MENGMNIPEDDALLSNAEIEMAVINFKQPYDLPLPNSKIGERSMHNADKVSKLATYDPDQEEGKAAGLATAAAVAKAIKDSDVHGTSAGQKIENDLKTPVPFLELQNIQTGPQDARREILFKNKYRPYTPDPEAIDIANIDNIIDGIKKNRNRYSLYLTNYINDFIRSHSKNEDFQTEFFNHIILPISFAIDDEKKISTIQTFLTSIGELIDLYNGNENTDIFDLLKDLKHDTINRLQKARAESHAEDWRKRKEAEKKIKSRLDKKTKSKAEPKSSDQDLATRSTEIEIPSVKLNPKSKEIEIRLSEPDQKMAILPTEAELPVVDLKIKEPEKKLHRLI